MRGIVACEALYHLVERFSPDAEVRYIPAELHEFPVNVPLEAAIGDRVQAAIDELDEPSRDVIVVSYAMTDAGRRQLTAQHVPLVVSEEADCTSTVLPTATGEYGENKETSTLYLTRGWIDCGVDSYKLYRAYRGDLDDLLSEFEAAADRYSDLQYTWHRGERFERAADRQVPASSDPAESFFRSVVAYFDCVALVDTGDLYEVHHEYAERVRRFVEDLRQSGDSRGPVELTVVEGQTDRMAELLETRVSG